MRTQLIADEFQVPAGSVIQGVGGAQVETHDAKPPLLTAHLSGSNVDIRLNELRGTGNLFIQNCDNWYNLQNDPKFPFLSETIKWQILHVAKTRKDEKNKIYLDPEFYISHLNPTDLALLYKILKSYHEIEKNEISNPKFQKAVFFVERVFANLCWKEPAKAKEVIRALDSQDATLISMKTDMKNALKLLSIIKIFRNQDQVENLFTKLILNSEFDSHIKGLNKIQVSQLLGIIKEDYQTFLEWLKGFGVLEQSNGPNKVLSIIKGQIAEIQLNNHNNLISKIIELFPTHFKDILGKNAQPPHYLPGGMKIMLEEFSRKDGFKIQAIHCDSYSDYADIIKALPDDYEGVKQFNIRCRETNKAIDYHQVAVTLFKSFGKVALFITDTGPFDLKACSDEITTRTFAAIPDASVYSTMSVRQRDHSNCGFITLEDTRTIAKDHQFLISEIAAKAKPVAELHKHMLKSGRVDLLPVKVTAEIPLQLIKSTQSLMQIDNFIKDTPADNPIAQKLISLRNTYKIVGMDQEKEIYAYTSLKSIKYLLHIAETVFKREINL